MSAARQNLADLLAMGRVANIPSVLSNTFLGAVLAWWLSDAFNHGRYLPYNPSLFIPLLAGVCFYLGGCFLNDWADVEWDRQHRPERLLPLGRCSPLVIGALAFSLLGAGLGLCFLHSPSVGIAGLGILSAIAVYTILHKRSAWGVVPMGLCRALLYPLGFLAQPEPVRLPGSPSGFHFALFEIETKIVVLVVLGAGLLSYIAGLSLFARRESTGTLRGNARLLAFCLLCVPLLTHTCIWASDSPLMALLGVAPFSILLLLPLFRGATAATRRVGLLLASIALVDFISLPVLAQRISMDAGWGEPSAVSPLASPYLLCAVPLAAYLLGRFLQRLAPAS